MTKTYVTCTVEGCLAVHKGHGYCNKHLKRVRQYGTTDLPIRTRPFPHGTINAYARHGCRCALCRAAERANKAGYRQRHRERTAAAAAEYEQRNKERIAARRVAERKADPAKFSARTRKYAENNPEAVHLNKLRRRAREAGADNRVITVRDWLRLCERFRHCCAYCGERKPLTRDHVIPLSRGGRNAIGNLVPACGSCNYSKGQKLLVEWRRYRRNLQPKEATPWQLMS